MGDSEIVVAQTSAIMGHTSATYSSANYGDASLNEAPDDGSSAVGATGDLDASVAVTDVANKVPDGSDLGGGNEYDTNLNSARHEAPSITTYDSKTSYGAADANESIAGLENTSVDASEVAGSDSAVYANNASEANDIVAVGTDQNGGTSDDLHGPISVHQLVDGSALSTEEDRLWSIVRANSLDFDAWTALIEETEKIAEDNILKIRKVYDAFLAEFPLCYGYWKKYADHEARLGSIDKVVEVYERAVQGVTYSVDMWLHYCAFAMITYRDVETIRRCSHCCLTSFWYACYSNFWHE